MKHQAKQLFRDLYARALYYTGLHAVVNRMMPKRFTILLGHCLDAPEVNGGLPADMKISADKLRPILTWLKKRYSMQTLSASLEEMKNNSNGQSLVAVTMDDGYRDNATHLLPFMQDLDIPATIYLESRPLDERRTNWSHLFFWLVKREGAEAVARRYLTLSEDADTLEGLRRVLEEGDDKLEYRVKRVLKYDANFADRDRVLAQLFRESGGDEQALADELYLTWDQVRSLRDAGWELGGHTINHPVLARLTEAEAANEISTGGASLVRELGGPAKSFAYPFGRPWDYNEDSLSAVRSSDFQNAVTTTAGTNDQNTDPFKLRRIAIGEESQMHLIVAEVCGGFDLLRRFGLDLSA